MRAPGANLNNATSKESFRQVARTWIRLAEDLQRGRVSLTNGCRFRGYGLGLGALLAHKDSAGLKSAWAVFIALAGIERAQLRLTSRHLMGCVQRYARY